MDSTIHFSGRANGLRLTQTHFSASQPLGSKATHEVSPAQLLYILGKKNYSTSTWSCSDWAQTRVLQTAKLSLISIRLPTTRNVTSMYMPAYPHPEPSRGNVTQAEWPEASGTLKTSFSFSLGSLSNFLSFNLYSI